MSQEILLWKATHHRRMLNILIYIMEVSVARMKSGIKYWSVSSFSSLALIIFRIWIFPYFNFSTHTTTTPCYMNTSQILIHLFLWKSREKRKNYQLIEDYDRQRSDDFLILHKDLSTPGLTQIPITDTCFYIEPIKGSWFVISKKIMKLLMCSHTAIPEFHLFLFGRHLFISKMWQSFYQIIIHHL